MGPVLIRAVTLAAAVTLLNPLPAAAQVVARINQRPDGTELPIGTGSSPLLLQVPSEILLLDRQIGTTTEILLPPRRTTMPEVTELSYRPPVNFALEIESAEPLTAGLIRARYGVFHNAVAGSASTEQPGVTKTISHRAHRGQRPTETSPPFSVISV